MSCQYGGDTPELVDASHQILEVIMNCYPGHNVQVYGFNGGVFRILHLDFDQVGSQWGMVLKGRQFFSASHMRKEVITKFGEWLERANLIRGKANGDEENIQKVEGVPLKNHANAPKPEIDIEALIDAGQRHVRENPRPQALIEAQKEEAINGNGQVA